MAESTHQPYISQEQGFAELSVRAVVIGCVLGVIFAAANTYLGLYAGMTISASIPASVISMALLRSYRAKKRGTILEHNIVQTLAGSGESLAAGVIFTVPALLIAGIWREIGFWQTTLISICGSMLGICFMIPLRQTHIVEDKTLVYPEGVACAQVLKAGESGGAGARYVFWAIAFAALFKFLTGGLSVIKGTVETVLRLGKVPFYIGSDISPALVGVGYICGFNISLVVMVGGVLSWWIAMPFLGAPATGDLLDWYWETWSSQVRYLGVGAMIIGGIWSIVSIRRGIQRGLRDAMAGMGKTGGQQTAKRTERSISPRHLALMLLGTCAVILGLYYVMVGELGPTAIAAAAMLVMAFFFVAVSSYIVGLVGNSNQPVSGMTICAVLGTAGVLLLFGISGDKAVLATLLVAGVVCAAACSAGDNAQDLKTGHILGATPKAQQWMNVLGAIVPALIMAPILTILHQGYGIGTGQAGSLKAPQAELIASIVKGLFGQGSIPWGMVYLGMAAGVMIIAVDVLLEKRRSVWRAPVMAVAVGMYLPFTLGIPMLLGGLIAKIAKDESGTGKGTLFASGLVAGEAIIGVVLAALMATKRDTFPITLIDSGAVSVGGLLLLGATLWIVAVPRGKKRGAPNAAVNLTEQRAH